MGGSEVCSNWRISLKNPWSCCKPVKTKPVFCCSSNGDVCGKITLKYREKWRQSGRSHNISWLCCLCIYSRPCEGLQRRLDVAEASAQRHAQEVHAELALDAFKLFPTPCYQLLHIPVSQQHTETWGTTAPRAQRNLGQGSFWQGRWASLMKAT